MLRPLVVTASAALALTACSSLAKPSVRSALTEAGVRAPVADCMAQRMTDRLSISQLQTLRHLKGAPGEKASDLSALEIVERVNRVGDPEVVAVTASAGAACALTS